MHMCAHWHTHIHILHQKTLFKLKGVKQGSLGDLRPKRGITLGCTMTSLSWHWTLKATRPCNSAPIEIWIQGAQGHPRPPEKKNSSSHFSLGTICEFICINKLQNISKPALKVEPSLSQAPRPARVVQAAALSRLWALASVPGASFKQKTELSQVF